MLKRIIAGVVVAVMLAGSTAAGPVEDGAAAYKSGDYAEAVKMFRLAADQGIAPAQFLLGAMYANGQGVPQDYSEAVKWYRLAADQGDAEGQFGLGVRFADGRGVPQDYTEAVKWYRLAADRSHAQAQYNLALSYSNGEGVSQDYVRAHMWFNLAAAHFPASDVRNHEMAVRNRGLIANKMTREQIAEAQNLAREWKPR